MVEDETITPHNLEREQDMVVQYENNFIRMELRVAEYLQLKNMSTKARVIWILLGAPRKVILTEVYVRQLLKLVINNARKKTLTLESLYEVESHLRALESLGVTTQQNASFLYPLVESSLPEDMLRIWQRSALAGYSEDEEELPISIDQRLQRLLEFLRREVKGEQRLEYMREGFGESSQRKNYGQHVARMHTAQIKDAQGRVTPLCLSCKGRYWIEDCARKVNACFRCLRVGHMRATCRTQICCSHCKGPHHTALHLPSRNTEEPRASTGEQEVALSGMHVRTAIPKALLATARGSQSSFLHQDLLHHLTVPVQKVNAQIYGINDTREKHVKQKALVVGRMTRILPSRDFRIPVPSSWKALPLADPQFETSGRVDVILVADVYGSLLLPEFKYDEKTQLCAQETRLYRENYQPMNPYRLNTVTYSTSPALFLAPRTLIQLASNEGSQNPKAAEALRKETYVDDISTGAEDSESAMLLREEFICLLQKWGFVLKMWACNDPTILNQMPVLRKSNLMAQKCFQEPTQGDEITKRGMLSLEAKLLIPWDAGNDWDAPIDGPIKEQWKKFREQLGCLRTVRIPRCLGLMGIQDIQLHGFSDASEDAYAAAVYIRISGSDGIRAELVAAKTRLAPVRRISIPRLELCAAVLLTRLITHILTVVRLDLGIIVCWTDTSCFGE
ncbi:hypothetical protein LAZ67_14003438 [Cordylochernes scorpioides]|uniref:CCHC-type domain-containing protein n=1 Tax=Cordylochernes scorpioides TaxID=51811 RepID=A0ABY6LCE9_9ARAC|nr:hypothetical protein LAZ67_14003438 [Cordylochernes scorpioides]